MAEDSRAIEAHIAQTRERLGDTVGALVEKTDVRSRVRDQVADTVDSVKDSVESARGSLGNSVEGVKGSIGEIMDNAKTAFTSAAGTASDALDAGTRSTTETLTRTRKNLGATVAGVTENLASADVPGQARRAVGAVAENPLGLVLGALAIGFLAGSVLPISEGERRRLQPIGERIVGEAQAATSDLVAAGKAVATETAQSAVATALHSVKTHGQEVVDAAKSRAAI